jgi:hypothetical protein
MINDKIINVIINDSNSYNKDIVIKELLKHIDNGYDYNDIKKNHILEMLVDTDTIITIDKVNIDYVIEHFVDFMYKGDRYNYRNLKVENVDNIDCLINVSYEYMEKINEDRGDIDWVKANYNINFNDRPEVLKKS